MDVPGAVVAVVVVAAVALVAAVIAGVVARRSAVGRLGAVASRLAGEGPAAGQGLEAALTRLERAADRTLGRLAAAEADGARLARALDAIPQGVVICDGAGREVHRNRVAQAFTGARHAEALIEQAVHDQLGAALEGRPQRRDLDLLGPPRRMLVIAAVALEGRAGVDGALAVIDDVSERRRLEAVRRDFVANISHELKTPVGALGLLAETIAAEDDAEVGRRLAQRMTVEAFRVARIIDDLLDLSRIEAEEMPVREPVALHLVVAEAVERIHPLVASRSIAVVADEVPRRHTVRGDRRQLVSAVANLLENACKYSDPGSTVEVRSTTDESWLELAVVDHGIGIPGRDLERIFERFYRVDRARSRQTGGTGLGLAIVRHVAGNHGGEVRVDSREGEGSTFTLRLPAGPGPVAVSPAGAEAG